MISHTLRAFLLIAALSLPVQASSAGEVKVLTAGAFKQVVVALVPDFEKQFLYGLLAGEWLLPGAPGPPGGRPPAPHLQKWGWS